ncbi:MAG: carboxypeptidase M32 [Phycisphaerales bacterium]|jgi:carboxypeptidase Taq|nr:carboxypeptidase M32 [Phycisphaerales bacterium]
MPAASIADAATAQGASPAYRELKELLREIAHMRSTLGLLQWDQETYMPAAGSAARAGQKSLLAGLAHERATSPRLGELIAACEGDAALRSDEATAANLREMRRDYDLATKLPGDLVRALAETTSRAQDAWKHAREKNDFASFAPWLDKVLTLTRRKAECYGVPAATGGVPSELYDALLDEYEPSARAAEIETLFRPLEARLSAFVKDLRTRGTRPDDACVKLNIAREKQHAFGQFVIEKCGFRMNAGRLDEVTHPFCEGLAPGDTRLTTRYRESRWTDAFFGTLHEYGHGSYEQGLPIHMELDDPRNRFGEPLGHAVSLGIHESQSRMWENIVGRSRAFWQWAKPHADRMLGSGIERFSAEDVFRAVNVIEPGFIRVEADEGYYNLHIMLRFALERAMIRGDLAVRDLPGAWNERFKALFGVDVPDDTRGCLQDVHWSFGLIGYFPTYTLGNLYAASFWNALKRDLPDVDAKMERGEFAPVLSWFNDKIHRHGRMYPPRELCRRITGADLSTEPLMAYLGAKLGGVYGVS